jgi:SSS family solute:Na+ symporter
MEAIRLHNIDLTIMIVYAVLIIAYGLYHAKRKDSEEYFLAGRNMIWPIVGISLFAANISSSTLVGLASSAYQTDTHVYNYEWLAAVVLVFFAIFFLPFYLKSRVYTMPEFLERRYDSRSRYYFSCITIIGNVLIDTAAGLYVGNIVLQLLFPGLESWIIIVILAFAAAAYTIPGGLNSVIQTEVIQAILLVIGSIILTWFAFDKVGGWSGMIAGLDAKAAAGDFADKGVHNAEEILSLVRPSSDKFMPWYGLLLGAPILGFYFWANNQFMVQRVLGAKSLNHGRWGALFAGLLKIPVLFIMVIPGTLAIMLYADTDITNLNYLTAGGEVCKNLIDCPNATYPILLFDLLPTGLLGLVLAGLLAAMMSSVSATFNSASTLITMDFVKKFRPKMTSQGLVRAGQISTLFLVILASLWATQIDKVSDSLFEYLQLVLSFICPPIAAAFILGLFWKRANASGSIVSLSIGFVLAIIMLVSNVLAKQAVAAGVEPSSFVAFLDGIHFLMMTFYIFVICMAINIIVSLATAPPPADKVRDYTWSKSMIAEETEELSVLPWYQNYRYLAIGLLIITAIVVGFFW